jgi:hypothetical protein
MDNVVTDKKKDIPERSSDYLIELVKQIRPSSPKRTEAAEKKFRLLIHQVQGS